jgi:hypothetical protein
MSARCSQRTASGEACRAWAVRGTDRCAAHLGRWRNPPTLSEAIVAQLESLVRAGNYLTSAITAAGLARRTFYDWWKRGEPAGELAEDRPFRAMRERIEHARAEGEARNVALIARAAAENWIAAAWLLERQYPERWGPVSVRLREGDEAAPATPLEELSDPFGEVDELAQRRSRRSV